MSFWSDVSLVASREARERGRGRTFMVSTVLGIILVVGAIVAASVLRPHDTTPTYQIGLVGQVPPELGRVVELTGSASGAVVTTRAFPDLASAEAAVKDGSLLAALLADGTILVDKRGNSQLESLLTVAVQQYERFGQAGLSQAQVDGLLTPAGPVEIRALDQGKTNPESLTVAFIGAVLLMLAISLYGQWVMLGVLEEKTNRVVELVVAAIPIRRLLAGKVVGIGMLGVGQLVLLLGAGVGAGIALDVLELPRTAVATAVWAVVWFLLGYAFYAVLYAAAGSLVSRQADASAAGMPIALGLVAFYLATFTHRASVPVFHGVPGPFLPSPGGPDGGPGPSRPGGDRPLGDRPGPGGDAGLDLRRDPSRRPGLHRGAAGLRPPAPLAAGLALRRRRRPLTGSLEETGSAPPRVTRSGCAAACLAVFLAAYQVEESDTTAGKLLTREPRDPYRNLPSLAFTITARKNG